jgi:hypothetical protein
MIVIVMLMQLEFVETDQPAEQLDVETMQELLVNKDVQEELHHNLLTIVTVMLKQLEFVEMDQPAEQPDVEIMQEEHVNKDVQDQLHNLNL